MSKTLPATFLFSVVNSHIGYLFRTPNEDPLSNGLAIKIIKIVSVSVYKGSVIVWGFYFSDSSAIGFEFLFENSGTPQSYILTCLCKITAD